MKKNSPEDKLCIRRVKNIFIALILILNYHLKIFPLFLGILCDPCNHNECLSGNFTPCPDPFLIVIVLKTFLYLQLFNLPLPGKCHCSMAVAIRND